MGLLVCKDCKKEFSTDAKRCPHCGANPPVPPMGTFRKIFTILAFLFFVGIFVVAANTEPTKAGANIEPTKVTAINDGICKDENLAYVVVKHFIEDRDPNAKVASFNNTAFDYLDGCKMRVTSSANVTNKAGWIKKDLFSLVVVKVPVEGGHGDMLQVDVAETLK